MSTTNVQTVRMAKLSMVSQAKVAARQTQPIWLPANAGFVRTWEDVVAAGSLAVFVATVIFLFVTG